MITWKVAGNIFRENVKKNFQDCYTGNYMLISIAADRRTMLFQEAALDSILVMVLFLNYTFGGELSTIATLICDADNKSARTLSLLDEIVTLLP
uniref:Uncharacterized protein n=1 Tax=Glossina morsitans morsitans TaxID=37546 RepID=A0A1B0G0B4_GLOMM